MKVYKKFSKCLCAIDVDRVNALVNSDYCYRFFQVFKSLYSGNFLETLRSAEASKSHDASALKESCIEFKESCTSIACFLDP